jgi:segregation and condensation protein A
MYEEYYEVKVENIFEGPLDLLVFLIKKNEVDIYDIPIAKITEQYLEYLEILKAMNIDFAGEFILMASTLTHIKSRMLLPAHESDSEEDDPRMELTIPLLEYMRMKSIAEQLSKRPFLEENIFKRPVDNEHRFLDDDSDEIQVSLFDLVEAFQNILKNIPEEPMIEFARETVSLSDRIRQIENRLKNFSDSLRFEQLFEKPPNREWIVLTFVAILEMVKMFKIGIFQNVNSGIIRIFRISP